MITEHVFDNEMDARDFVFTGEGWLYEDGTLDLYVWYRDIDETVLYSDFSKDNEVSVLDEEYTSLTTLLIVIDETMGFA